MPVVLVVDDDPIVQLRFRRDFDDLGVQVEVAATAAEGLAAFRRGNVDVVVLDVMLPDLSGLELFRRIHKLDARVPVIFITASGESETAIDAMKLGGFDFVLKPLDREAVRALIGQALEVRRQMQRPVAWVQKPTAPDADSHDALVGRCPAMQEVYKAIGRVAQQDVTVLICGASGTGQELVARAIYQHSNRADGPFLAINCAALPDTLLESELFGHEKGAFTGANVQRIGKFEQCAGGTLFLDEIGDMSPATQSKLLRVLQDHTFQRLGGTSTIRADVRILAATNVDLQSAVANGDFRRDLFYRLNGYTIQLPPLRERKSDLPLLLDHFLGRFSRELGRGVEGISPEGLDLLLQYGWPGNVRELQSVLKQAILHSTGPVLLPDFLPDTVRYAAAPLSLDEELDSHWESVIRQRLEEGGEDLYAEALAIMERRLLTLVLQQTGGNKRQAARILGITRVTLRNKMNALGIVVDQVVSAPERAPAAPR